jgi:hypothetical protein
MRATDSGQQCPEEGFARAGSGTSGPPKSFFQTPEQPAAASYIAIAAQHITPDSRVLTVCRITHAGSALAQSWPALSADAHLDIVPFNVFSSIREAAGYMQPHQTPAHCEPVIRTQSFREADLTGLCVACARHRVVVNGHGALYHPGRAR